MLVVTKANTVFVSIAVDIINFQTVNIVLTRTLIRRIRLIQFLYTTQTTILP